MGGKDCKKLVTALQWNDKTDNDDLDWVAKAAAERGLETPEIVKQRSKLLHESLFYYKAYDDLYECSWADCKLYADHYGKNVDELWRILIKTRVELSKKPSK